MEADWFPAFENECLTFPRGKHDDQIDAFAYLGMMLDLLVEAPTQAEADEEAYEDEMEHSQLNNQGRSLITGY
jgi:phage terminase large subunit-like protein